MQCSYFDAGLCRSCTLMGDSYAAQLAEKVRRAHSALSPFGAAVQWLPSAPSREDGFRAKAKMVVGGTVDRPTLGILDGRGSGVDLTHCGIIAPGILEAFPTLSTLISRAGLTPYDVPSASGELKNLIVTEAASGQLMVRFVVRSEAVVPRLRAELTWLQRELPRVRVVTANIHPEHKAVLEGEVEHVLTDSGVLPMLVGDVELQVRPRSFVQTNTAIAAELYAQARDWVDELDPSSVWDLYCGVGGFALHCATPGSPRRVLGVESSPDAVASAELTRDARFREPRDRERIRFVAADATAFVHASTPRERADLVIVNPPRRGLGADLADWLHRQGPPRVIYSSCNVESLARDLTLMPEYRVTRARVLDMFPQSTHFEVITLLERAATRA